MRVKHIKDFWEKQNSLVKFLVYCGACLFVYIFILDPLFVHNRTLNKEIIEQEEELTRYTLILKREENIKSLYDTTFSKKSKKDVATLAIFSELEAIAKKCLMRVASVRESKAISTSDRIGILLTVRGQEEGFVKFIYTLKDSQYLFRVNQFMLRPSPDKRSLEAELTIFYIPTSQPVIIPSAQKNA